MSLFVNILFKPFDKYKQVEKPNGYTNLKLIYLEIRPALDDLVRQRALPGPRGHDHRILRVGGPRQEQLPRKSGLEVVPGGHDQLGTGHLGHLRHVVAEFQVSELEGIRPLAFEVPHELLAHPLDLGLGELDDVVGDVVEEGEGVGGEAGAVDGPEVVGHVGQLEDAARGVCAEEDVAYGEGGNVL